MRTTAALVAMTAVVLAGCSASIGTDPGPSRTEDRTVPAVTGVELTTPGTLVVTTGRPALRITAGADVIDDLTSKVRDGVLVLDSARSIDEFGNVRYELTLPDLRELRVTGSAGATVGPPSTLHKLEVGGSGDVQVAGLAVDALTVSSSGSGTITTAGSAEKQSVHLDGSGSYDGTALRTREAAVTVAGSGRAEVQATGTLHAVVEGSGTITYSGGATVDSRIDGSGAIRAR
jgi:hypothetical protein